jgi:hypothetical protein
VNNKRKDYEETLDMPGGKYYIDELDNPRKLDTKKGTKFLKKAN